MVKMYGPAFDKDGKATGKLVERDVPEADIAAYGNVGYKQGELTPEIIAADKKAAPEEPKKVAKKK